MTGLQEYLESGAKVAFTNSLQAVELAMEAGPDLSPLRRLSKPSIKTS